MALTVGDIVVTKKKPYKQGVVQSEVGKNLWKVQFNDGTAETLKSNQLKRPARKEPVVEARMQLPDVTQQLADAKKRVLELEQQLAKEEEAAVDFEKRLSAVIDDVSILQQHLTTKQIQLEKAMQDGLDLAKMNSDIASDLIDAKTSVAAVHSSPIACHNSTNTNWSMFDGQYHYHGTT